MAELKKDGMFPAGDADLYYRIYGDAPETLLLLHGNGEDWHCFDFVIDRFSEFYTVVTLDSRGHGRSGWGKKPLTIQTMAEDTAAFIDGLDLVPVSIVGFSDGANIAMRLALISAEKLNKLVLAGGNLFPAGLTARTLGQIEADYKEFCRNAPFSKEQEKKMLQYRLMTEEPNMAPEELAQIHSPVLVMAGERDMVNEAHTRLIHRSLPTAKLCILPGASHFVFARSAGAAADRILEFLKNG